MILPDVNVLVYAFRRDAVAHAAYASWLTDVVNGGEDLALVEPTLLGFMRIVTNRRVVADPSPMRDALEFVTTLRTSHRARWLPGSGAAWEEFAALARADVQIRGNMVPDAWLAALAIAHGCRLATADRGFARFPRLDWFDPVAPR